MTIATNTLAITSTNSSQTSSLLFSPAMRTLFSSYGTIDQWVPLRSFSRILCVYTSPSSAELAKSSLDNVTFADTRLGVFRVDANPLRNDDTASSNVTRRDSWLAPPVAGEFLFADDDDELDVPPVDHLTDALQRAHIGSHSAEGVKMLLGPEEAGVGVFVEDCDSVDASLSTSLASSFGPRLASMGRHALATMPPMFGM